MRLLLPHKGWHVRFTQDPQEIDDLYTEILRANSGILDEPYEEVVLNEEYDVLRLHGRPELCWVKEIWYWTDHDSVPFPEGSTGKAINVCMGNALTFHDYEAALNDLARVHEPVRLLLSLWRAGPQEARALARAVLDGERGSLPILADALEEAGHEDAKAFRKLVKAEPKRPKPQGGKGKPLPAAFAPAPAKKTRKPVRAASKAAAPTSLGPKTAQEVVLVGGMPAGGKSTLVQELVAAGYQRLNRDESGGRVDDLLPRLEAALASGKSVVMDNLYATRASRAGAVQLAKRRGAPIRFVLLDTSLEDAQFNACLRMIERTGRVLHPEDHKKPAYKDASLYPVAVLYKYRKEAEAASPAEGFAAVAKVKFVRRYPAEWTNKAVIFDFDGTLRTHEGKQKFPVAPGEVRAFVERAAKVREYEAQGYLLLGASNQSGIAKGLLTEANCEACFTETLRQLGLKFAEVRYCPHKVPPISCYCRKPGPGMGVELIVKYKLDPRQCIYVGDAGTDRSFAERCGFQFIDQAEFFAK
jgi:HAD superfamily hydrolase (TIGR01662 family)